MLGFLREVLVIVLVFMEIVFVIVDEEIIWEIILFCNDDKVIELVFNVGVDVILELDIWFVFLLVFKVIVDIILGFDNILDIMLVFMVIFFVVVKVSIFLFI